MSSTRKPSKIF